MGVIVSCRGKEDTENPENTEEEEHPTSESPDPENILTPIQTTNEFIRPLENPYPPLPPVDDVEYGPGGSGMARPKTYAVVVSRLAGHKWMKLRLEPRDRNEANQMPMLSMSGE